MHMRFAVSKETSASMFYIEDGGGRLVYLPDYTVSQPNGRHSNYQDATANAYYQSFLAIRIPKTLNRFLATEVGTFRFS